MTNGPGARQPRLTIFSASWHPIEGGAEKQLRQIGEVLSRRDWHVEVLTGGPVGSEETSPVGGHVGVHPISPWRPRHGDALPTGLELAARLLSKAPSTRPDVVIGSLVSGASLAAMAFARATGTPAVLRVGGRNFDRLASSKKGLAHGRFLVGGSRLIVVNAPHLADQLGPFRSANTPPVITIRNGVSPVVLGRPAKVRPRQDGPLRVIYYTNGGAPKNDPAFVRTAAALPNVQFRAVGRTDHLPDLPNLERRGWCSQVESEIAWADLVVNTSRVEGSPNFCAQGLALGKPILAFANEGVSDLHTQYPTDVVVTPMDDIPALIRAIETEDWRSHLVTAEIRTIDEAASDWEACLTRLMDLPKSRWRPKGRVDRPTS